MEHLQYPVGRFLPQPVYSTTQLDTLVSLMATAPSRLRDLTGNLSEEELAKTYREGSWTVQQLVHHLADIHSLNFLRMKKTLTEENSQATLIDMNAWAMLPDTFTAPIFGSLTMLTGTNQRFLHLVRSLDQTQLSKSMYHAIRKMDISMAQLIYMAVWHLEHHIAHIELALDQPVHIFEF